MNEDNRKAAIRMAAFLSGLVSERNPLSALRFEAGGVNILDGSQYIMGSGKPDAWIILDPVVDLFQMIRRAAADLKHKIEFACEIVAGDDVGIQIDLADEFVVIARIKPDFSIFLMRSMTVDTDRWMVLLISDAVCLAFCFSSVRI